ncbi:MAG: ribosome recycling factor [Mycoplasmataceae bacterium]|jgi:ribosome recycling factor|nr:ribosome recycling factor [Mycoplasmataceae bacterium]
MDFNELKEQFEFDNEEAIEFLNNEFDKIRSGRVNPSIFNGLKPEVYGDFMPLQQIANVQIIDARTVFIKPFDKGVIKEIYSCINKSNIGVNPIMEEGYIRLNFPQITEEVRIKNVKNAKVILEKAKTKIRSNREEARKKIKQLTSISEDLIKTYNDEIDNITKTYNTKLEKLFEEKEKELLKV